MRIPFHVPSAELWHGTSKTTDAMSNEKAPEIGNALFFGSRDII
ncbi:hypothetical protein ALQ79_200635 [Pseudomonas amygdali pv. lachrymans]|nr:hypothetical protein ALQ79_200635 [Pseudomonas amygdali pv. lachrymans]